MKSFNTRMKYMRWFLGFVLVALTVSAFAGAPLLGFLVAAPGTTFAFAAAAGTVSNETVTTEVVSGASSELLANTISQKITMIMPTQNPLDTILRNIALVVPVKSWETEWYQVDTRGIADTLAVAFDTSASGTFDSSTGVHTLTVTNVHIWNVDDNILVQDIAGGDGGDLVVHIVSMNTSAKTLGVIPINGFGTDDLDLPAIPEGTSLVRIGNSKAELDAQTSPYSVFPQKDSNYTQIHMSQIEQSLYDFLHAKEVPWDITDYRAQSLYDMRRSMELTSLFGVKGKIYDPEGRDYKYFSGGITRYITKKLGYTDGGLDLTQFMSWCENIFVGNAGSDQRIVFAGSDLIKQMSSVDFVQKQIEAKATETIFGIKFNRIESNFGVLLWKHHNLLNEVGWSKKAIVLDVNNIERHVMKQMETTELDLDKTGQRRAKAYRLDENFCVVTRYADTHAIIDPTVTSGSGS